MSGLSKTTLACLVLSSVVYMGATPDRARTLIFKGASKVELAGILQETKAKQEITLTLLPVAQNLWRIQYESDDFKCSLIGSGPEHAIILAPKQSCHAEVDNDEAKGTAAAVVIYGSMSVGPKGTGTFAVRAKAKGKVRKRISGKFLGKEVWSWSPVIRPSGTIEYDGHLVKL